MKYDKQATAFNRKHHIGGAENNDAASILGSRENPESLIMFWIENLLPIRSADSNLDFHSLSKPQVLIVNTPFYQKVKKRH
jgi:hypothetical protein